MATTYPLNDRLNSDEIDRAFRSHGPGPEWAYSMNQIREWANANVAAERTGTSRPPRKGEWYLSGAIIEAYRAKADLSTDYPIARLVVRQARTVVTALPF